MDPQLNEIAMLYKACTREPERSRLYVQLREGLEPLINSVRRRFKPEDVANVDFESIIDTALLMSLGTFKGDKGQIGTHTFLWMHEYTKRAIIANSYVKIPYNIAKKNYSLQPEDRKKLLDSREKKFLLDKYKLTESEYNSLVVVESNLGKSVAYDVMSGIIPGLEEEDPLTVAMDELTLYEKLVISCTYGICGYKVITVPRIAKKCKTTVESVMKAHDNAMITLREYLIDD